MQPLSTPPHSAPCRNMPGGSQMVEEEGQRLEKDWEEKHWEDQLQKRRLGGAVPAPRPVTPTEYASQMLQEGRDNGEDKTQAWGEGVRRWENRHSTYFTFHPFPTLHPTSLLFLPNPPNLPLLGWAGPCTLPPATFQSPGAGTGNHKCCA